MKDDGGDLKILLVKRADRDNDPWSGHMAFPGGRRSPLDLDLVGTAHRETLEETGIDISQCTLLGSMDPLNSTVAPDLFIQPFIYISEKEPEITLNEELRAHYWVSLNDLRGARGTTLNGDQEQPAFLTAGEAVWGLTYRMLERFFGIFDGEG